MYTKPKADSDTQGARDPAVTQKNIREGEEATKSRRHAFTNQDGWSSLSSAFGETAVVKKDRLERVAAGCVYKVNNKYDQKRRPYPPTKIVRAALEQVGKRLQYSVTSANCEHFVTELRYGDGFSDQGRAWGASSQRSCGEKMAQVDDAKTYAVGGGIALAAVAAVMFSGMRNNRQKN
ncbi:phospholipase A and acyltransferase 3-like isoform X3 [Pseudophryne corroboree]|uniref:phospholipase A and acyltransferase 3-like isoform X3 n=1 Tax=Pseudophryne corroboree TaxID=495146 RepID=UPI003081F13F